jgi:hypothetical protein
LQANPRLRPTRCSVLMEVASVGLKHPKGHIRAFFEKRWPLLISGQYPSTMQGLCAKNERCVPKVALFSM